MVCGLDASHCFPPRLHRPCFLHGRHFLRRRSLWRCRRQVRLLGHLRKGWGSTCQSVYVIHWFLPKFAGHLMILMFKYLKMCLKHLIIDKCGGCQINFPTVQF